VADLSSLTKAQIETLKIQQLLRKDEINMEEALKTRKSSGISRGTHYRILSQARKNVKESLFTVAVAAQIGVLKPEDIQRLVTMVAAVPVDLDSDRAAELLPLIQVLADRIVMF
jgi:predicted DNA-binding protein (UPF0251 family)